MKKLFCSAAILMLIIFSYPASAAVYFQNDDTAKSDDSSSGNDSTGMYPFYLDASMNTKDILLGGGTGVNIQELQLSMLVFFSMRPVEKTIYIQQSALSYRQFQEWRYNFGLLIEKRLGSPDFGVYLSGGGAYSIGDYDGSDYPAEDLFVPVFNGGFYYGNKFSIRIGYQYMKLPQVPANRGCISLMAIF